MTPDRTQDFDNDLKEFTVSILMRRDGLSANEIAKNMDFMELLMELLWEGDHKYLKVSSTNFDKLQGSFSTRKRK